MEDPRPFGSQLDLATGRIDPSSRSPRHLSQMTSAYEDQDAVRASLADGEDPLVYEVYEIEVPRRTGHLLSSTTILQPGTIGDEYFMTKGHFHANEAAAEIYVGVQGIGVVLMRTREGDVEEVSLEPGAIAYIPPAWAHRTINTGDDELVFYAIFPGDAGYDYETIEREGFGRRLRAS